LLCCNEQATWAAADSAKAADGPLSPNEFRDLKLLSKEKVGRTLSRLWQQAETRSPTSQECTLPQCAFDVQPQAVQQHLDDPQSSIFSGCRQAFHPHHVAHSTSQHTTSHCRTLLQITHNSYHLRFELPGGASANMPVASCLLTKASLRGPADEKPKVVVRPYTPVSAPDAAGHLDLVIKAYPTGTCGIHW